MHPNCYIEIKKFVDVLTTKKSGSITVCDVGSRDVNGTFKGCFPKDYAYNGIDIQAGPNVDIVLVDQNKWDELLGAKFDVVISGNVINHTKDIYRWFEEFGKLLKPGGDFFIISPFTHCLSRWPLDSWRVMPDGMKFLVEEKAGLKLTSCYLSGEDIIAIGTKL